MNLKDKLSIKAEPVEKALAKYLKIKEPKKLYEAMAHIPLSGGKRLRPVMALLACELVGGVVKKAVPFATAIETIHNFTLVHDDVMDDDKLRHGVASAHVVFGTSIAILAGDGLFSYGFEMVTDSDCSQELKAELVRDLAITVREISEGQQMDLDFENRKYVSPEEYLKMIRLKTSILFGAAAFGGSRIGGASLEEADELRQMATNIGLGFQIWDDYLDATVSSKVLGKDSGSDIRQGKRTLLVIEALNRASKSDCKRLLTILDTDDNKDADIAEAVAIMEQCGALNKCHDLATEYLQGAEKIIYKYSDSEARQLFLELLEYMVSRGH